VSTVSTMSTRVSRHCYQASTNQLLNHYDVYNIYSLYSLYKGFQGLLMSVELKDSRNQLAHLASILQDVRPAIPGSGSFLTTVRGCSAVSPNEKVLATTNLYDGIDWYFLNSNHFMDVSFQHTTTHTILENVILPLMFVHNGTAVLSGTSTSCT